MEPRGRCNSLVRRTLSPLSCSRGWKWMDGHSTHPAISFFPTHHLTSLDSTTESVLFFFFYYTTTAPGPLTLVGGPETVRMGVALEEIVGVGVRPSIQFHPAKHEKCRKSLSDTDFPHPRHSIHFHIRGTMWTGSASHSNPGIAQPPCNLSTRPAPPCTVHIRHPVLVKFPSTRRACCLPPTGRPDHLVRITPHWSTSDRNRSTLPHNPVTFTGINQCVSNLVQDSVHYRRLVV